jgi:iron(II)-dependent oxidoreductase
MLVAGSIAATRRQYAELLAEARSRTLLLVSTLTAEQMTREPGAGSASILAQLQGITAYESRLLLEETPDVSGLSSYDAWFDWMMDLRERVLQRLDEADLSESAGLTEQYQKVLQREYHTDETILETIQLLGDPYDPPGRRELPRGRRLADPGFMTRFPGGKVEIGGSIRSLSPFWIDVLPVTNGDYLTFMAAGGYTDREVWSEEGWEWLEISQAKMPEYWSWDDGVWWSRCLLQETRLDLTRPVIHVSCYEAEAFARFVGKRLPSEIEWEAAAAWDPETQSRRLYPWGNMAPTPHVANLDQLAFAPAPVGAFPGNLSPIGCYGMIGDVWEWTSSDFDDESKVLRGGSWATRAGAINVSVRRASRPENRNVFSGFRCALNG